MQSCATITIIKGDKAMEILVGTIVGFIMGLIVVIYLAKKAVEDILRKKLW
jgi:acid phosphatase family membrane protein YuiD